MEHKITININLKCNGPCPDQEAPESQPQPMAMKITPEILNSLLAQLPHAMAAMQAQVKPTGHPPKA